MSDAAYFGLSALALAGLSAMLFTCWRARGFGRQKNAVFRGLIVTAFGMAVALVGGVLVRVMLDRAVYYQQVRFVLFYLGFAAIVRGFIVILSSRVEGQVGGCARIIRVFVAIFALSVTVGLVLLFVPGAQVFNRYGEQVQLPVYFAPMIVATAGGSVLFLRRVGGRRRRADVWVGVFALGLLIGVAQESGLVPVLGNALLGILGIFVPFAAAAWCLKAAASAADREVRSAAATLAAR